MKKFSKLGVVLLVLMFLTSVAFLGCDTENGEDIEPAGNGDSDTTDDVADTGEREELVMGTNADFPPFEFIDDNNEVAGFDVDLAKEIADILNMDLKIENMDFDGLVAAVSTGMIDMAVAAMTITEERKEQVNFSDAYIEAGQVIVVREDYDDIEGADDLTDKKVAAQLGTTGAIEAENLGVTDLVQFTKITEVFMELAQGKVDAVVVDAPVANLFMNQQDGLKIVGDMLSAESYGIAVSKENTELLNGINDALSQIKESGKYDELLAKWFDDEEAE